MDDKTSGLTEWQKLKYTNAVVSFFYSNSFTQRQTISEPSSCKKVLRTIYQISTSHFGLVILLVLYSFLGAAIFQAVEGKQHGLSDNEKLTMARSEAIHTILNYFNATDGGGGHMELLQDVFDSYEYNLTEEYILFILPRAEEVWNFWGSMFFCATVYTTIGYGDMFPVTKGGKWLTIVYSLFGIPLCLITIANLGILFTSILSAIYKAIVKKCRCCCTTCLPKTTSAERNQQAIESHKDKDVQVEDYPDKTTHIKVKELKDTADDIKGNGADLEKGVASQSVVKAAQKFKIGSVKNNEDATQSDNQGEGQKESEGRNGCCCQSQLSALVPIFITVVYMLFGVLMYSRWEDWDFTDAFYFLFISLSTIGFGDIVPEHRHFFLASGFYILFGLSLVAMTVSFLISVTSTTLGKAKERVDMLAEKGLGVEIKDSTHDSPHKVSGGSFL